MTTIPRSLPEEVQHHLALYRHSRTIRLVVRYGEDGEQVAIFRRVTPSGGLVVKKWLQNSRRWTGDVYIRPGDVVRLAEEKDLTTRKVEV